MVSTCSGFTLERVIVRDADVFFTIVVADVATSTVIPFVKVIGGRANQKSVAVVAFIAVLLHSNVMLLPAFALNSIAGALSAEQYIVAAPLSFSLLLPLMVILLIFYYILRNYCLLFLNWAK